MEFRIQEIIKTLVPGATLLTFLYLLFFPFRTIESAMDKDFVAIYLLVLVSFTYVCGYFVDWFGSLLERLYYKKAKKPSEHLLNDLGENKSFGIRMSKHEQIGQALCACINKSTPNSYDKAFAERLFKIANVLREQNTSDAVKGKLTDFYFYTIFSRNLAAAFFSTFLLYPILYFIYNIHTISIAKTGQSWTDFDFYVLIALLLSFITFFRWKEHAIYYSRQIFYAACPEVFKPANGASIS